VQKVRKSVQKVRNEVADVLKVRSLVKAVVLINGLNGPAHRPGQAGPRPEAQPKSPCGVRLGQM
jgi:hypothetical protein